MKDITKEELYKRQTTLQEIGHGGQRKLLQAKVLVVGCGGLGSAVAVYLAASGVGEIHLIDFDKVSESNLHRQVFYKIKDIGKPKVEVLANHIKLISPFVKVKTSNTAITKNNVFSFIANAHYVLDCTDSLPIKYLLNDACVLKDKGLIYGSLYKFDGYVSSFNIRNSEGMFSTNLRDAFPEMSKQQVPNCSEIGTLNTIVGIIGMMQANEILKLITSIGKPLVNELLIFNSLDNSQFRMKLKKSWTKKQVVDIFDRSTYFDPNCEVQREDLLISNVELRSKLSEAINDNQLNIISVIEDVDASLPFEVTNKIPLARLDVDRLNLSKHMEYVIVCNKGISSYAVTKKIKEKYPDLNVFSLEGGISSY